MNRSPTARSRVAESWLALALLCFAPCAQAVVDPWPQAPPDEGPPGGGGGRGKTLLNEYRYAAGLYLSLEESSGSRYKDLSPADRQRLLRGLISQGKTARAAALAGKDEDLPAELRFQAGLAGRHKDWNDREFAQWQAIFAGEDGESLYWQARLAMIRGDRERARELIAQLLRREAGSVFAPAALELLAGIPAPTAIPEAPASEPPVLAGIRVQWGAFRDPAGARRLREALAAYGQSAEILSYQKDGVQLYRVCSPVFADEAGARAAGDLLKSRYGLDYVLQPSPARP